MDAWRPLIDVALDDCERDATGRTDVIAIQFTHQLQRSLNHTAQAILTDEHVMRLFGQHELRAARERIERALGNREQLVFAIAIGQKTPQEV